MHGASTPSQLKRIPANLDVELDIQGAASDPWEVTSTAQWLLEVLFGGSGDDPMDDTDDVSQLMASMVDVVREVCSMAIKAPMVAHTCSSGVPAAAGSGI